MTSISSNSAAMSPADRMQYALQAAVQAGTVNASDQTALSSALNNIDTSLQSTAASSNTTNLDPGSIQDQVNSLINGQVSNGTLTPDQGNELQQVFAQAAHKMGGGHHHHMHVGGGSSSSDSNGSSSTDQSNPIDSLFADMTSAVDSLFGTTGTTATSDTSSIDSSSSTTSTSSATGASTSATSSSDTLTASIDQLISMLKQIEQKAVSGYTANGATTGTVANDSLLVNATA